MKPRNVGIFASRTAGKDQHAEYEISIDGVAICWHRYREFDALYQNLCQDSQRPIKPLPPKRLFQGSSQSVIRERQKGLDEWLKHILLVFQPNSKAGAIIRDFLNKKDPWIEDPITSPVHTTLVSTSPTKSESKLRDVVAQFISSAATPSPYASLSKISLKSKESETTNDDFNAAEFRAALEANENIFVMIKPTKT